MKREGFLFEVVQLKKKNQQQQEFLSAQKMAEGEEIKFCAKRPRESNVKKLSVQPF
jgi:hypothetical protein